MYVAVHIAWFPDILICVSNAVWCTVWMTEKKMPDIWAHLSHTRVEKNMSEYVKYAAKKINKWHQKFFSPFPKVKE